jgi:thioredoxin reductase (NADPH)
MRVANFEGEFAGGLVVNVNELHSFDDADGLSGMDHALQLASGNTKQGVASRQAAVTAIQPIEGGFSVVSGEGALRARAVVIATGARIKRLGVPGEDEFEGRGVSFCADCDGPMFADSDVVVAGGGDWAIQDALLLASDCANVHVVHPSASPNAFADALARARAEPRIRFHSNAVITAVLGNENGVTAVRVRNDEGTESEIACSGVFVMGGLEPNAAIAPSAIGRDETGHLIVDANNETAVQGIWAIGQVRAGFGGWLRDAKDDAERVAAAIKARFG